MIGIIGYGSMGSAIVEGLYYKNDFDKDIYVSSGRSTFVEEQASNPLIKPLHKNKEVFTNARIVFISVKPYLFESVAQEVQKYITDEHIIISLSPMHTEEELFNMFGTKRVVRIMPNTPMRVREGVMVSYTSNETIKEEVEAFLSILGKVYWVSEKDISSTIGIAGSGSAFAYMFLESLGQGGILNGLKSDLSYEIVAQTLIGAGKMYLESKEHPAKLRDAVCSPGGITIKGVQKLEENGFKAGVIEAVKETKV
jgi:pyrroline-5-carboxylate reductase